MTFFSGASSRYRLYSPHGWNPPKMKMLFYVRFVTRNLTAQVANNLSFFVKKIDRLQMNYEVESFNQYNKKRLVQSKMEYGPLNFTINDTVDGTAVKFLEAYNRFYFGDFVSKNNASWNYDVIGSNFEFAGDWGLSSQLSPGANQFIERIEVYEMYDQVYSQINFINPMFSSVEMDEVNSEESAGNTINFQCKYEGVVFQAIAQPVTEELADLWGLPYHNDIFSALIGGLNIPGFDISSGVGLPGQSILSSIANAVNNKVNGGQPSTIFNVVNSVLNGVQPTILSDNIIAQTINGYFGSTIGGGMPIMNVLSPLSSVSNILPGVQNAVSAGKAMTNISMGSFNVLGPLKGLLRF